MSNYDIIYLGKKAEELGFVRDTLEKVTTNGVMENKRSEIIVTHLERI